MDATSNAQLLCILILRKLCNSPQLLYQSASARVASAASAAIAEQDLELDIDVDDDDNAGGAEGDDSDEAPRSKKQRTESSSRDKQVDVETLYSLEKHILKAFPENYTQTMAAAFAAGNITDSNSAKMNALQSLLLSVRSESKENKVVVVSNFTQTLDMIAVMCRKNGFEYLRLDGSTSVPKRQNLVEQFNSPYTKAFLFLLSARSGGTGLNLIGASRLVLFDIDWNPATDAQAMARIWRDGQKHPVTIYRLLTVGTIEEKMYQRQLTKLALSATVMDDKRTTSKFSQDDLRDLFTLHNDTSCLTHDLLECSCQDVFALKKDASESDNEDDDDDDKPRKRVKRPSAAKAPKRVTEKANLSINELKEWQHFAGSSVGAVDTEDDILDVGVRAAICQNFVSFVFQRLREVT